MRRSLTTGGAGGALALLLLAGTAHAQTVGGGVSVGTNVSEINVSGRESLNVAFTDKFEPVFGGFVTVMTGRQSEIEIDGLWSVKGSLLDVGGAEDRIRLTYIDVPVLFRFY